MANGIPLVLLSGGGGGGSGPQGPQGAIGPQGPQGAAGSDAFLAPGGGALTQLGYVVTTGSQATVVFNGISQNYNDLIVMIVGQDTDVSSDENALKVAINGDFTSTDYTNTVIAQAIGDTAVVSNAGSVLVASVDGGVGGFIPGTSGLATAVGEAEILIPNYTGTVFHKIVRGNSSDYFNDTTTRIDTADSSFLWKVPAAVTAVRLKAGGTAFTDGTTVVLYGRGFKPLALSGTYAYATQNVPYSESLAITGGNGVYSLYGGTGVFSGTLPPGLALSIVGSTLVLSGTPTTIGHYIFTVAITSSDGQVATSLQDMYVTITYATEVLADTPIRYWKLDESSGTVAVDSSGNGGDGTYSNTGDYRLLQLGAPKLHKDAIASCATYPNAGLPGATVAVTAVTPTLSGDWTFECVRLLGNYRGVSIAKFNLFAAITAAPNGTGLGTSGAGTSFDCIYCDGGTDFISPNNTVGKITHLAATKSGTIVSLYEDGVLVASGTSATATLGATIEIMGSSLTGSQAPWYGYGSDFALYNYALSATRVLAHARAMKPANELSYYASMSILCKSTYSLVSSSVLAYIRNEGGGSTSVLSDQATLSSAQYPFIGGGQSIFIPNSNQSSVFVANVNSDKAYALGNNNFVMGSWVYLTSVSGVQTIISASSGGSYRLYFNAGVLTFYDPITATLLAGATTVTAGNWYFVAAIRRGPLLSLRIGGIIDSSTTVGTLTTTASNIYLGTRTPASDILGGYLFDPFLMIGNIWSDDSFVPTAPLEFP